MKIKAILIDAGGVYFKGSIDDFVEKSCRVLNIKNKLKVHNKVISNEGLVEGKTTVIKHFRNCFDVSISNNKMKKLIRLWNSTWTIDKDMIKIVKLLKNNYVIALFSNLDKSNSNVYRKKGWYELFDHLILSFELRTAKPDKRIYKIALKKLKLKPQECLFIDNQKAFLTIAKKLGMKTLFFTSTLKLRKDLKQMKII